MKLEKIERKVEKPPSDYVLTLDADELLKLQRVCQVAATSGYSNHVRYSSGYYVGGGDTLTLFADSLQARIANMVLLGK